MTNKRGNGTTLPTFGLYRQGHVMSGVVLLPEGSQSLVHVDLLLLWLLLQRLGVSWCVTKKKKQQHTNKEISYNTAEGRLERAGKSA